MPYKFETDNIKMPRDKDKRVKLTDGEREEIKNLYGKVSQRKLANIYGVSRRLITFIGDENKLEQNIKRREERGGWIVYYKKEKHTIAMKRHRQYKKNVLGGEHDDRSGDNIRR